MKNKTITITIALLTSLNFSSVYATQYYVSSSNGNDSNNGLSIESPWATLAHVSSANILPGDNINFKSGDTFVGQLKPGYSGAENNPIKFTQYGTGDKPIINGSTGVNGDFHAAVFINNQEYIELDNLEITNERNVSDPNGWPDTTAFGISVLNNGTEVMSHFRFTNLTVRNVFPIILDETNFNKVQSAGIHFRSEKNKVAGQEKHIRDVVVDNNYITMIAKFGIWSQHAGGETGIGDDMINRNMDYVLSNNHTYKTGGSGITPGGTYNALVENNFFEYPGSDADARMTARGSGAWFFNSRNIVAQYNVSKHARGSGDSYGMHIDHSNEYVLLQYNYSEDSHGGFAEILGNNKYSTYRFNISVNDGRRATKGNTLWVSQYPSDKPRSDHNYIYNNSIYINKQLNGTSLTTGIDIDGKNTSIFNNAFYVDSGAIMGEKLLNLQAESGSTLLIDNNLFYGSVASGFTNADAKAIFNDPSFAQKGQLDAEGYKILNTSVMLNKGRAIVEPPFPMAGQGIFSQITANATVDYFGTPVDLSTNGVNVGAYNGAGEEPSFTVIHEAENAIYNGGAILSTCSSFSSGEGVKNLNVAGSTLEFQSVYATAAGFYPLTISTLNKSDANLSYQINEGSVQTVAITGSGLWCYEGGSPQDIVESVYLEQGFNKITFTNSPVIDKITIGDKAPYVNTPTDFEAESAKLTGAAESVSCATASQGVMVKNVKDDENNAVIFNNIEASGAGTYPLTLQYFATSARNVKVSVNQGTAQTFSVPVTGQWCFQGGTPGSIEVNIPLEEGVNSIKITGINVIDKITVH